MAYTVTTLENSTTKGFVMMRLSHVEDRTQDKGILHIEVFDSKMDAMQALERNAKAFDVPIV